MKVGDVKVRYRRKDGFDIGARRMVVFVWGRGQFWEEVFSLPIPDHVRANKSGFKEWKERALALWQLEM